MKISICTTNVLGVWGFVAFALLLFGQQPGYANRHCSPNRVVMAPPHLQGAAFKFPEATSFCRILPPVAAPESNTGSVNPVITCPLDITVSCASQAPAPDVSTVTVSGGCGGPIQKTHVGDVLSAQSCPNRFVITRTYKATDPCGNTATCVQRITVDDQLLPVVTCPANITISCPGAVPAANPGVVQASDNCGGTANIAHLKDSLAYSTCPNHFVLIRLYQATDACGNTNVCLQRIRVDDQEAPAITCPPDLSVSGPGEVPPVDIAQVVVSDLCGGAVTTSFVNDFISNQTCLNRYQIARTFMAADGCNNMATCVQRINVNDQQKPSIICPKDITVSCDEQLPPVDVSAAVVSDNCGGTVSKTYVSGLVYNKLCLNRYQITRTYMATDACGNTSTCTQHVEVKDEVSPKVTCPPDMTLACGDPALAVNLAAVIAADNCGSLPPKAHQGDKFTCLSGNRYQMIRTYIATDACGQVGDCTQRIEVTNLKAWKITCPANLTVACPEQVPVPGPTSATITDNCANAVMVTHAGDVLSNQTCASRYQITRTFRATDPCGATATCTQRITVNDITAPTIVCPANTTVSCASQAAVNLDAVMAGDNCGGFTKSFLKDVISNKVCENNYTLTRTYKVVDACGSSATCNQVIRVLDQTPPPIVCPANITVSCVGEVPVVNANGFPVSDNCSGTAPTMSWLGDLSMNKTCDNRYQIARTYRATDACGFSASCIQKITVQDQTAPTVVCPASITVSCAAQVPVATPAAATAQDNCPGGKVTLSVSDALSNTTCANRYLITRTYTAKDVCGNQGTCAQLITIKDQTPPSVTCPAGISVTCASLIPVANTALLTAVADNCSGTLTRRAAADLISDQVCPNRYVLTRVYEVSDACGNTGSCTQRIVVSDQTAPTITCPAATTVSSTAQLPAADPASVTAGADNCGGTTVKSLVGDLISGQTCAERYTLTRTYQVADLCGNSRTCQQRIVVDDRTAPVGACPKNVPVACADNIPCSADDPQLALLMQQLKSLYTDNSGTPVVVSLDSLLPARECSEGKNTFGRTIRYRISDACSNQTSCTVDYSGACFCTHTQDFWGDPVQKIGTLTNTQVIDSLLRQGWITVGDNTGCSWTANTAPCIFKALPATGPSVPFKPGELLTCSAPPQNSLAGQLVALQLNIRYNQVFRGVSLGSIPLAGGCALTGDQVKFLGLPAPSTVNDLLALANAYLASDCNDTLYAAGYGDQLTLIVAALNGYWDNCQNNKPCAPANEAPGHIAGRSENDTPPAAPAESDLVLQPNPVLSELQVRYQSAEPADIRIQVFGPDGKLMSARTGTAATGLNTWRFDVSDWRPGLYWLTVDSRNNILTRRFLVLRP